MQYGRKMEEEARQKFQNLTGTTVSLSGLVIRTDQPWIASSPDGVYLEGDEIVLLEIKCPISCENDLIQVDYIKGDSLVKTHQIYTQIQIQMYCCNTDSCVLFVYSALDYKLVKVKKDIDYL